jgi:GntR family transcriptional regulator, galactonate operon transcriptional repressor
MSAATSRANHTPRGKVFASKLRVMGDAARTHEGKIHGSVVDAIGRWILGGTYAPDDLLPREDDLAEQLGVSRTSVREAVKVLSAKGLLQARRRVGVRVRDRDDWNLLDPQVLSWHPDVGRDEALITSLIEARQIIEPAAAALAAKRATAADLARIEQAYLGMERNLRTNLEACCEADLKFHVSVVAASHNVVLKGLTGTIEAALRATFAITNRRLASAQSRALSAHRAVFESVRMRDADGARLATIELLEIAARDLDRKTTAVAVSAPGLTKQPKVRTDRMTRAVAPRPGVVE